MSQALRLVKPTLKQEVEQEVQVLTELDIAVQEYLISAKADGLSERTLRAYEWHLLRLVGWLSGRGVLSMRQVKRLLLREWLAGLHDDWQPATIKQAVSAARAWLCWSRDEGLVEENFLGSLKFPKVKSRPQRTITEDELQRLIAVCGDSIKDRRDAAIVSLLFDSGLRSAELCRLRLADVDLEGRELHAQINGGAVLPGWFGEVTKELLFCWLEVRTRVIRSGVGTVFVGIGGTTPGRPLTPDGLRPILRELGKRAEIAGVNTHAFRRGFAVSLSAAGVSDNVLKDLGRWSTTQMIKRYTMAQQVRGLYQSPVDRSLTRNHNG